MTVSDQQHVLAEQMKEMGYTCSLFFLVLLISAMNGLPKETATMIVAGIIIVGCYWQYRST